MKQLRDYSESLGIVQPPPKDDAERLEVKEAEKHADSAAEAASTVAASNETSDKVYVLYSRILFLYCTAVAPCGTCIYIIHFSCFRFNTDFSKSH